MSFRRILIAVDGSPISINAARTGLDLARALGADVAIAHAVEPPVDYSGEIGIPDEVLLEAAGGETQDIVGHLRRSAGLSPNTAQFIRVGHADEVIGWAAAEWSADLIVIGSHGRGGLGRVLLGSVAQAVIGHATCPVLVTRKVKDAGAVGRPAAAGESGKAVFGPSGCRCRSRPGAHEPRRRRAPGPRWPQRDRGVEVPPPDRLRGQVLGLVGVDEVFSLGMNDLAKTAMIARTLRGAPLAEAPAKRGAGLRC